MSEIGEILAMGLPYPKARDRVLEIFDMQYVTRVLKEHGGNVTQAAAASGIGRRYLNVIRARVYQTADAHDSRHSDPRGRGRQQ